MKNLIHKVAVTAGIGVSMLVGAAVPAFAVDAEAHCPHGLTVSEVVECACVIAATTVDSIVPGTAWDCSNEIPI